MTNTLLAIDIGSSTITAVIAKNTLDGKPHILGTSINKSEGIEKGLITNIEVASRAIKNCVENAKNKTSEIIDSTIVSVSGAYAKGIRSSGSVNVPAGVITESEINQVLQMALYNAVIIPEYDVLHVLPISFKVDDSNNIDNPLDMNGSRLEVAVYIVTARKTALTNIKNALKASNLEVTNFVLNGYASAISVLNDEQKKFGIGVVDIGGSSTDVICCVGKAIIFNDYVPVGSAHITNDLSVHLSTPMNAAEKLKREYGTLIPYGMNNQSQITKVKLPIIGDEEHTKEITLDSVQTLIHARVEELLILIRDKIRSSGLDETMGAGLVITGGMSKLPGIKELANKVFEGMPVKIATPGNYGLLVFDDAAMATILGLIKYGLDISPSFELDSNKVLRRKYIRTITPQREEILQSIPQTKKSSEESKDKNTNSSDSNSADMESMRIDKKDTKASTGASKIWKKISEWF